MALGGWSWTMRRQRRRAARIAGIVAAVCFGVFLACVLVVLVLDTTSKTSAQRVTTAAAVFAALSALAVTASALIALRKGRGSPAAHRRVITSPHLMRDDRLVDRSAEMTNLVFQIGRSRVVNCHGQRGAGKSFLLEHLADVVNGHRGPARGHPYPKKIAAAVYFDLADATGFEAMRAQVCQATLGDAASSWARFIDYVGHTFSTRKVLLILDNVNTPGVWSALGEAAYQYLAGRPADILVLGSIDPVVLRNLDVDHVALPGLDFDAVSELVAIRRPGLSSHELSELCDQCDGLPLYVRLLTAAGGELARGQPTAVVDSVIDDDLLPELMPETRSLLAYVSLLALVNRQVKIAELEECPVANLEANLLIAERRSLVTMIPQNAPRLLKIHDLVRDSALRTLTDEVSEAALMLFVRAGQRDRNIDAALFAMYADPEQIDPARFDEVLRDVVGTAVALRNHALLSTLHTRSSQRRRTLAFIAADQDRRDLFCFGRASELAGLGRYADAQAALDSSSIANIRPARGGGDAKLGPEMRFLQADIAHLQNRYDEAADMFKELGAWAEAAGHPQLRARCTWGHAHVLRHQGRELDGALSLFDKAVALADAAGELFTRVYSVTGATGIKVYLDTVPEDEEGLLVATEAEIAMSASHSGYMLEVWKSQAQVARTRGDTGKALEIVEAAIERALATNDRLLYNLYFERAELRRHTQALHEALKDYGVVLRFGESNSDRNLIANAQLGMAAVDLDAGAWLHHESATNARAAVLRARDIARAADIDATAQAAERLAAMIDEPGGHHSAPPRLILF